MVLSCFPKFGGGGLLKALLTSINGYFLVPVSEMDVYIVFFYISLVFLVCLVVVIVGFFCFVFVLVLNIEWFKKKLSLANDFFSQIVLSFSLLKKFVLIVLSSQLAWKTERLHLINEESISLFLQIFTASTEFFIRTRSLPHLVSIT